VNEIQIGAIENALWVWDPYGVADLRPEIVGEYDSLLGDLLRHLRQDESIEELVKWQTRVIEELGLESEPADEAEFIREVWRAIEGNRR
jgi:hypothetical protein